MPLRMPNRFRLSMFGRSKRRGDQGDHLPLGRVDPAIGAGCKPRVCQRLAEVALSCASSRALYHERPPWTALNILETTIALSSLEALASTDDCGSLEVLDATLVGQT